jgi:hypothetical protein
MRALVTLMMALCEADVAEYQDLDWSSLGQRDVARPSPMQYGPGTRSEQCIVRQAGVQLALASGKDLCEPRRPQSGISVEGAALSRRLIDQSFLAA